MNPRTIFNCLSVAPPNPSSLHAMRRTHRGTNLTHNKMPNWRIYLGTMRTRASGVLMVNYFPLFAPSSPLNLLIIPQSHPTHPSSLYSFFLILLILSLLTHPSLPYYSLPTHPSSPYSYYLSLPTHSSSPYSSFHKLLILPHPTHTSLPYSSFLPPTHPSSPTYPS